MTVAARFSDTGAHRGPRLVDRAPRRLRSGPARSAHDPSRPRQSRGPRHRRQCPRAVERSGEHPEPDRQRDRRRALSGRAHAQVRASTPICRWSTQGRPNAVGHLRGRGDGLNLLFTGHMDTSYSGDEEHLAGDGFKPKAVYRDGWVFGLGANNMKSGLAAALVAIEAIVKAGIELAGDISFGGVVGEIEKSAIEEFQGRRIFRLRHRHAPSRDPRHHGRFRAAGRAHRHAHLGRQSGLHLAAHHGRRHGRAFGARQSAERGQRHRGHARAAERHRPMGARLRGRACLYGRASERDHRGDPRRRALAAVAQPAFLQPLSRHPHRARPDRRRRQARAAARAARLREAHRHARARRCMSMSAIRRPCSTRRCRSSRRSAPRRRR